MTGSRRRAVVAALAVLALAASTAAAVPASAAAGSSPVVTTDKGTVKGRSAGGVDSFLGIPYAAPPVGALRWQPPQAHAAWTGVRPATRYGDRCAALASTNGARSDSEDCLFVNVQRPTGTPADRRIPVYVFVHGGGLVNGSSNQAGGAKIVRTTNAVVVTMNYRLGVFGFLGLPGLSVGGEGDYGFLDQQFALQWVQRNIAAFGGDPAQVTLGGESAGAFSVCAHLTSPGSRGLFARAMMQSGSCLSRRLPATEQNSAAFAAAAGCAAADIACLRNKPAAELLDASTGFSPTITSGTAAVPRPPANDVARGRFARVPIVNGSNRDEGRTFVAGMVGLSEQDYVDYLHTTFGANADAVLAHYPWPAGGVDKFTATYLIGAIVTDDGLAAGIGGCTELKLSQTFARYVPTYAYEFDARDGPGLQPIPGYVWGAGHAAELAYLFPSFDNGTPIAPTFDAGERQLSLDMIRYWTSFVFRADPATPGQAAWPRFDRTGRLMSLRPAGASRTISTDEYRTEHQCDFWDALPG